MEGWCSEHYTVIKISKAACQVAIYFLSEVLNFCLEDVDKNDISEKFT